MSFKTIGVDQPSYDSWTKAVSPLPNFATLPELLIPCSSLCNSENLGLTPGPNIDCNFFSIDLNAKQCYYGYVDPNEIISSQSSDVNVITIHVDSSL